MSTAISRLAGTLVVLVGVSVAAPPSASASAGAAVRVGDVVVVDSSNGSRELTHGGSATEFSLRLPQGASCPGDSANDQWRFQSFIIPQADSPATLHYGVIGPDGPGQYALYQVTTNPLTDALTNQNSSAGQPGLIPAIPPLSFAVFPPGTLSGGRYRIGIACTLARQTATYWDTELVVTASLGDKPGQLVWRLADVPASVSETAAGGRSWLLPGVIVAAVAIALGWLYMHRKPRKPRKTLAKSSVPKGPTSSSAQRRETVSSSKEPQ